MALPAYSSAIPILWSTQWIPNILAGDVHGPSMNDVHDALPFVAVVAAGALWRPIASLVDVDRTRPWVLVAALNALNVADVLFTRAALHSGQAVEANPFAAWMGPGVKLIGVGSRVGAAGALPPPRAHLARARVRRPHRLAPQRRRPEPLLMRLRPPALDRPCASLGPRASGSAPGPLDATHKSCGSGTHRWQDRGVSRPIFVVDAFSEGPFRGNPAGVVPLEAGRLTRRRVDADGSRPR